MAYRMLIADDEKRTRESIASFIDWGSIGVEIAGLAGNGMEALEMIRRDPPDILLSDIRMPHLDGICLARTVSEEYPDCRIIFLSGYTDKEYLKSAITLKVENYIEKPIDPEELMETVRSIVRSLDDSAKAPKLLKDLKHTSRLIRSEIAALLLTSGESGYIEAYSRFYPLYFNWKHDSDFTIAAVHIHEKDLNGDRLQEIAEGMYDAAEGLPGAEIFISPMAGGDFAWISSSMPDEPIKALFKRMAEAGADSVSGGITHSSSISELPDAWHRALLSKEASFYFGRGHLIGSEELSSLSDDLPPGLLMDLPETYDESISIFDTLAGCMYRDIHAVQDWLYRFYLMMMEWTVNGNTMKKEDFIGLTLSDVRSLILYGMNVFNTLGNNQYNTKVKNALHYILWHYADANLSIKMIADKVGLSQNYLSNLFKQETGNTVNSFIIDVRIEKTQKLLRTTDLKLYEISPKVGIPDPNYLSIVFKNRTGMTPSEYRLQERRNA